MLWKQADFSNSHFGSKFENAIDLLQKFDGDKLHYMYIKGFERFMFHKTKNRKYFSKVVYSVLVVRMYWQNIENFVWAIMAHNL